MIKKIKQKMLCFSLIFGLFSVFLIGFVGAAKAELAPGNVKLDKDFNQKIAEYILTQPIVAGPFTGKKQDDMEETLPFYTKPLTKYNISVESPFKKQEYNAGETIDLNGKISFSLDDKESQKAVADFKSCENCPKNIFRFPNVSNVGIFVQIWRKDSNQTTSKKGDFLVDEFYGAEGINLTENKEKGFITKWQIPEGIRSGDYYVFLFVNSDKRFNLVGSPLVAFFQAAVYEFKINEGEAGNGIELDKDDIKINGTSYAYRQPAPEIAPNDGKITISLPLTNLSLEEQNIRVTYNLYNWGQEDPADLISSKQENVNLGEGEKSNLEYSFAPSETSSVYNLQVKAISSDSVSASNVRFLVKGINRGIFRFLGSAKDPDNQTLPVFCIRNASWNTFFTGKVKISGLDAKGNPLQTFEKEGAIKPEDHCFIIKKDWLEGGKIATLKGEIFDGNGRLVDKKESKLYFGEEKEDSKITSFSKGVIDSVIGKKTIILIISLIIILAIGGYLILLKRKQKE